MMKKTVLLLTLSSILCACSKDDLNFVKKLEQFKDVYFSDKADEIISSQPTGNIINVGNVNKKEVLNTVKRQIPLNPMAFIDERNTEVIYPGSILRGDSFMNGIYDPIVVNNSKPITISATL